MPKAFVKSASLTALILIQIRSTDLVLSYVQNTGLPKESFLLIGAVILSLAIIIYRMWAKQIV